MPYNCCDTRSGLCYILFKKCLYQVAHCNEFFVYRFCQSPLSTGAYKWPDDITEWPVSLMLSYFGKKCVVLTAVNDIEYNRSVHIINLVNWMLVLVVVDALLLS